MMVFTRSSQLVSKTFICGMRLIEFGKSWMMPAYSSEGSTMRAAKSLRRV